MKEKLKTKSKMIMRHTYSSPGPKLLSSTGRPATLNSLGEACSYEEKRKQEKKKQIGKIDPCKTNKSGSAIGA
jgi:hypothetical protein